MQLEALRGHLKELSKFSEAELVAALGDVDDDMEEGEVREGASEDDSSDDSKAALDRDDEKTLADMVVNMRKKALEKKQM